MALKTKIKGRDILARELRKLAPEAEKAAVEAKLKVAQEAAAAIAAKAPIGSTVDPFTGKTRKAGEYKASIKGGLQRDFVANLGRSQKQTKDPNATGIYANYIWRFLEFGTRPHVNKGAATGSSHPGSPAQEHVFSTWRTMRPKAKRRINSSVYNAIKRTMGK